MSGVEAGDEGERADDRPLGDVVGDAVPLLRVVLVPPLAVVLVRPRHVLRAAGARRVLVRAGPVLPLAPEDARLRVRVLPVREPVPREVRAEQRPAGAGRLPLGEDQPGVVRRVEAVLLVLRAEERDLVRIQAQLLRRLPRRGDPRLVPRVIGEEAVHHRGAAVLNPRRVPVVELILVGQPTIDHDRVVPLEMESGGSLRPKILEHLHQPGRVLLRNSGFLVDEITVEAEIPGHLDQLVRHRERPVRALLQIIRESTVARPEPAPQRAHAVAVRRVRIGRVGQVDQTVHRLVDGRARDGHAVP